MAKHLAVPNYPSRIYEPMREDGKVSYWLAVNDPHTVTLPEWIEGQARGTMKKQFGVIFRLVTVDADARTMD